MDHHSAVLLLQIAGTWQRAYEVANGKTAPKVEWENGWFIIDKKRYRRSTLERMIATLRERAQTSGK